MSDLNNDFVQNAGSVNSVNNTSFTASSESMQTSSSSAETSSASVESSSSSSSSADVAATEDYAHMPLDKRTSFEEVNNRTANFSITEKDGSVIKGQFHAPSLAEVEEIGDTRFEFIPDDNDNQVTRMNNKSFHEALFKIIGGMTFQKPGESWHKYEPSWDFFNDHREAYRYIMNKAATFYNAD